MYTKNELYSNDYFEFVQVDPHYLAIKGGFILPWRSRHEGGVLDENRVFIESSKHVGEWLNIGGGYSLSEDYKVIHEKVVYLGFFIRHWGHFIIDCLGRLWNLDCFEGTQESYKYVFLSRDSNTIDGNYKKILNLLGIHDSQIIICSEPTQFDIIIVPDDIRSNNEQCTVQMVNLYRSIANRVDIDFQVPEKVYFSRRKFAGAKKKEFGEETIEEVFTKNGYLSLCPEELSAEEQIHVFKHAKEIACVNGTIPLNIVWAGDNKDLKLIVINKTSIIHKNMLWASKISGIQPIYVDAWYEPITNVPFNLGMGPYWLRRTNEIKKYWTDNGFEHILDFDEEEKLIEVFPQYLIIALKNWFILKKDKLIIHIPFKREIKQMLHKVKQYLNIIYGRK